MVAKNLKKCMFMRQNRRTESTYVQLKEQREVSLLMSFCLLSFPAEKWPAGQPLCTGKLCCSQGPATAITRIIGQMPAIFSQRTP